MSYRLNHYLALCGVCSRRAADRIIEEGRVRVNGQTASLGVKVEDSDIVTLDDREIRPEERDILIAVNKPVGVVCTEAHFSGEKTLASLVNAGTRVFSIGRLDKDSSGLILMTNNGALAQEIAGGSNRHEKEYVVGVNRPVTEDFLIAMRGGVDIEIDGNIRRTRPCRVKKSGLQEFHIVLTQGMNRQIRRMCRALGYSVRSLSRIRVMNIELGDLAPGCWRYLSEAEAEDVRKSCVAKEVK